MDIEQLKQYLENLTQTLKSEDYQLLKARLVSLKSAFPFSQYEYILMYLRDKGAITLQQYEELREKYVSANPYLDLYGIAPRKFGEIWAHPHIMALDSRFKKASKEIDPTYKGEYDLWINGVKVEIKTCRATKTKKSGYLLENSLKYGTNEPFWMNFQQIKAEMADVFIFIGVWVDKIVYWVLSRKEIKKNKYLSPQHRGGIEYQIGITDKNIAEFNKYRVEPSELAEVVLRKGKRGYAVQ
ncbi:MAG: restriction endonuclease subunit M [candidate division WOR-3 bacterium]